MKTIALLLAVLLPLSAFAQAKDAPLNPHPPGRSLHLMAGEIVPYSAQCLEDTEHSRREWSNERAAGELADLKKGNVILPTAALVAIIGAGAAAVVTAVVLGVALSAKK